MNTGRDTVRSVAKYVAETLGDSWDVRWAAPRGEIEYPFCRVRLIPGVAVAGNCLYHEVTQPMAIECQPQPAADEEQAYEDAFGVAVALERAIMGEGVGLGRPRRIPLFDYAGVDLAHGSTARSPEDYLAVVDFATRLLENPSDGRMVAVMADLRVRLKVDHDLTVQLDRNGKPIRGLVTVESVSTKFEIT